MKKSKKLQLVQIRPWIGSFAHTYISYGHKKGFLKNLIVIGINFHDFNKCVYRNNIKGTDQYFHLGGDHEAL